LPNSIPDLRHSASSHTVDATIDLFAVGQALGQALGQAAGDVTPNLHPVIGLERFSIIPDHIRRN